MPSKVAVRGIRFYDPELNAKFTTSSRQCSLPVKTYFFSGVFRNILPWWTLNLPETTESQGHRSSSISFFFPLHFSPKEPRQSTWPNVIQPSLRNHYLLHTRRKLPIFPFNDRYTTAVNNSLITKLRIHWHRVLTPQLPICNVYLNVK